MLGVIQGSSTADSREASGSPEENGREPWNGFTERGDCVVLEASSKFLLALAQVFLFR